MVDMTAISPTLTPDNETDVTTRSSVMMTETSSEPTTPAHHPTVTAHIAYVTSNKPVTETVTDVTSYEAETNIATGVIPSHRTTQTHNAKNVSIATETDFVTDVASDPVTSTQARNTHTKAHRSTEHITGFLTTEAPTQTHSTTVPTTFPTELTGIQNQCDNSTSIGIVTGVFVGIVLFVLVTSFVCVFRLRHKWQIKIQMERKKTDIWSMATFNNTIINENFSDYQLASVAVGSSAYTQAKRTSSMQMFDHICYEQSNTRYSGENDVIERSDAILPQEFSADGSALRRNTFSAPDGFYMSTNILPGEQELNSSGDNRFSCRDRSSTFTAGKKYKVDRHILLSHEELVESDGTADHLAGIYTSPTNGYYMTEL